MTASPEFRREVIRHANRRGYNSQEVSALLDYTDYAFDTVNREGYEVPVTTNAVVGVLDIWEESFDVEP